MIEKQLITAMEKAGLSEINVTTASVNTKQLIFSNLSFAKEKIKIKASDIEISADYLPYRQLLRGEVSDLAGKWSVKNIAIAESPLYLPPLSALGKWSWQNDSLQIEGSISSADKLYHSTFSATINATESAITAHELRIPWQGGIISSKNLHLSTKAGKTISAEIKIEKLPLAALLQIISGNKANGSGEISGTIPFSIDKNGKIRLGKGKLYSTKSGIITIDQAILPGNSPQMEIARAALTDFHYSNLTLTTQTADNGKAMINMSVEGNSPQIVEKILAGKKIKLNVNLSGDVLEMLLATMNLLQDPLNNKTE